MKSCFGCFVFLFSFVFDFFTVAAVVSVAVTGTVFIAATAAGVIGLGSSFQQCELALTQLGNCWYEYGVGSDFVPNPTAPGTNGEGFFTMTDFFNNQSVTVKGAGAVVGNSSQSLNVISCRIL